MCLPATLRIRHREAGIGRQAGMPDDRRGAAPRHAPSSCLPCCPACRTPPGRVTILDEILHIPEEAHHFPAKALLRQCRRGRQIDSVQVLAALGLEVRVALLRSRDRSRTARRRPAGGKPYRGSPRVNRLSVMSQWLVAVHTVADWPLARDCCARAQRQPALVAEVARSAHLRERRVHWSRTASAIRNTWSSPL